jgi:hypothetical protein
MSCGRLYVSIGGRFSFSPENGTPEKTACF